LGDNKYESLLLSSDIELELGNLTIAENILQQLNKKSFDVLIRMAKIKDHRGNLEGAIKLMEKALDEIKNNNNEVLKNWTLSNLGDMYGHNNQYKISYNCYLKVLQSNATYYHCLKGIAWIAYAHDKNVVAAKKVLNYLNKYHPIPDYALLLAEIEGFEKNEIAKSKHLVAFTKMTKDKYYGDMYNKYNFYINTDEFKNVNEALRIANIEVSNRPTPESYSLLSWAYYLNGDEINALKISKTFVENKCIEPDVLANMAIVYKATGETKLAKIFYKDAMESAYELGPEKINNIKRLYNAL
jgi:tetratricopeptide (TPR) repeat protein